MHLMHVGCTVTDRCAVCVVLVCVVRRHKLKGAPDTWHMWDPGRLFLRSAKARSLALDAPFPRTRQLILRLSSPFSNRFSYLPRLSQVSSLHFCCLLYFTSRLPLFFQCLPPLSSSSPSTKIGRDKDEAFTYSPTADVSSLTLGGREITSLHDVGYSFSLPCVSDEGQSLLCWPTL
jgi:hypothetical protein